MGYDFAADTNVVDVHRVLGKLEAGGILGCIPSAESYFRAAQ